jgi:hypothetical protein
VSDRDRRDEELDALGRELRRLPTPMPPDALVFRVRRLAHLELADQADESLSRWTAAFLVFFSWTATVVTFAAVRMVRAGSAELFGIGTGSTFAWSAGYFAAAWISGAAMLVLLGLHRRREGGLA